MELKIKLHFFIEENLKLKKLKVKQEMNEIIQIKFRRILSNKI